jgi:ketosteroid isomerase-like protein
MRRPARRRGEEMDGMDGFEETIRRYYDAYVRKDRAAIESLLSDDFTFSSPRDDEIDRAAYMARCWPNSRDIKAFHIQKLFRQGDEAFVMYDLEPFRGDRFRNVEYFTRRAGRIGSVRVFFGSGVGTTGEHAGT